MSEHEYLEHPAPHPGKRSRFDPVGVRLTNLSQSVETIFSREDVHRSCSTTWFGDRKRLEKLGDVGAHRTALVGLLPDSLRETLERLRFCFEQVAIMRIAGNLENNWPSGLAILFCGEDIRDVA